MSVKTSSKRATRKAPARKPAAKKAVAPKKSLKQDAPETKYQCKKCKRKITVLVGVSSVWCNRCANAMLPV